MSARLQLVKLHVIFPLGNFLGLQVPDFETLLLVVFAKFDFATVFPTEDYPLRIHNDQFAWNETRILKFQLGNLALPAHGAQIGAPRDCSCWDEIVSRYFDRLNLVLLLHDFDDFVKMPGVMSDPLAFQI
jgi:hypothetical protein